MSCTSLASAHQPCWTPGSSPSPAAPELCQTGKAQQDKLSFWGDGLGAGTAAAWRKHSGIVIATLLISESRIRRILPVPKQPRRILINPCPVHHVPVPKQRLLEGFGFSHCLQSRVSLQRTISELQLQTHSWLVLPTLPLPCWMQGGEQSEFAELGPGRCSATTNQ